MQGLNKILSDEWFSSVINISAYSLQALQNIFKQKDLYKSQTFIYLQRHFFYFIHVIIQISLSKKIILINDYILRFDNSRNILEPKIAVKDNFNCSFFNMIFSKK